MNTTSKLQLIAGHSYRRRDGKIVTLVKYGNLGWMEDKEYGFIYDANVAWGNRILEHKVSPQDLIEDVTEQVRDAEQQNRITLNVDQHLSGTDYAPALNTPFRERKHIERTKEAYQDGADFFAVKSTHAFGTAQLIARYEYPFTSRLAIYNITLQIPEWEQETACKEAAAMFLRDNPEYKLVNSSELADRTER